MTSAEPPGVKIEPFDPEKHDRTAFSCGVDQVDNFFQRTANKLVKADKLRVFVMVSADGEVMGYYALNAHAADYTGLPAKYARTRPGHGQIPAVYISMIGVDVRFAGHGFGGDLLVDGLKRIHQASQAMGIAVVMLDVLDFGGPQLVAKRLKLYTSYGFAPLPSNPLRLFLPLSAVSGLADS